MKIGFVGCGAIGSCYASILSKKHEVCVLDTYAPVIEAIRKNGILVDQCVPGVIRESAFNGTCTVTPSAGSAGSYT